MKNVKRTNEKKNCQFFIDLSSFMVFISRLMLSVSLCPKVITLSGFYCEMFPGIGIEINNIPKNLYLNFK